MADTFILSNAAASLDIADGTTYIGPLLGSFRADTPGQLSWSLRIGGESADDRAAAANALQRWLSRAATAVGVSDAVTLECRRGGSYPVYLDITGGTLTSGQIEPGGAGQVYNLTLTCLEYAHSSSYPVSVPGTLSGATAAILVRGIPGTVPALAHLELTDTSASGAVNRVRLAVAPRDQEYSDATDFTAWHDAAATGSATTSSDATALGGGYAALTSSATAWQNVATITPPSDALYRGRRDGYLRVRGSGTAIGTPSAFAGTVSDATVNTTGGDTTTADATTPALAGIHTSASRTGSGTMSLSRTGATSGETLLIVGYVDQLTGGMTLAGTGTLAPILDRSGTNSRLFAWIVRNNTSSAAITATVTTSGGTAPNGWITLVELRNLGTAPGVDDLSYTIDAADPSLSVATADSADDVVVLLGIADGGTVTTISGITALGDGGWKQVDGIAQSVSSKVVLTGGTWSGVMIALSVPTTTSVVSTSDIQYVEPTPGELAIGTYTARVQGIDRAGYRGNATASLPKTTTVGRSSIDWSCATLSNAVAYVWTIQTGTKYYEVITATPSYTLTTLDGLGQVAALPATTGALAPPPLIRARIGTAGGTTYADVSDIVVDASNTWQLQRLFADRATPPVEAMLGEWVDSRIVVQMASANGAAATVNVDALWLVPSREPQATIEVPGMAEATPRRFVIESARNGRGTVAWRENVGTGAEVGQLTTFGAFIIPPGDAVLLLEAEQANGEQVQAASFTATLTVWPRHSYEWGGL